MNGMPCHSRPPFSKRGSRGFGLKVAALLLLPPAATVVKAQDALFNAISVQGDINSQNTQPAITTPPPTQLQLGPVQFNLGANTSLTYNDNINGAQTNAEADVISQTGINLGLDWPATGNTDLRLNTGIGYLHYFKYTDNNGLEVSPGSALNYALSWKNTTLNFYDQATYSRQVTTEAALAGVATLPQFGNTAGVLGEWDPGHWDFETSYSHVISLSDSAHDYLNSSSEDFFAQAGWRFAQATQAGVQASGSLTSYQVAAQSDNSSYSVGAYVEWQVKQWLQLTARGGPTWYQFSPQTPGVPPSTLNSYYVSLGVNHQITDFLSENLSLIRSVQLGANQGSDYVEQLTAAYSLSWSATRRINLSASLGYDSGQQTLTEGYLIDIPGVLVIPIMAQEKYQLYSGGLSASWSFTDHLSTSVAYSHTRRDSNLADRGYSADSATVQLSYNF